MEAIFNRHNRDFRTDFTIEFDVKFPNIPSLPDDILDFEWTTGEFTNDWAELCFNEITKVIKSKRWAIHDWSFAGRSNGWYTLLCIGEQNAVTEKQISKIEVIVEKYLKGYGEALARHYSNDLAPIF